MSDTAKPTESDVKAMPRCFITRQAQQDILRTVLCALVGLAPKDDEDAEIDGVELLAQGGYTTIWLIFLGAQHVRFRSI